MPGPDHTQIGDARPVRRGVGTDELRRHNLSTVLGRLHHMGPLSRSELTAMTGLNRSTIADLIGELTDLALVVEGRGAASSGPGRPSPVVRVRSAASVVLALQLDVDSIAVATVGLGGHVYNRQRVARQRSHADPAETVRAAVELARPLLDHLPSSHLLAGVGVAVAGVTRRSDGFVHLAPNLGWQDVALGELIGAALQLTTPALIANEADLGAVGEYHRGARPGARNLVYVSGEVGIGAGVIADGKLLAGTAGYAGEAGHMKINPGGRPCRCGGTGCWETEAGEAALLRHLVAPDNSTGLGILSSIVRRAAAGDEVVRRAIADVGRWLGFGIANLINLFNPEIVVLGGIYQQLFPFLIPAVEDQVKASALAPHCATVTIVRSALGPDAPLIGAAESVQAGVIANPAALRRRTCP